MNSRPVFDCDTYPYWCDYSQYNDKNKKYGTFIDDGKAYEITDVNTPRPWLNYLCNDKVAAAVSNTGKGFLWYKSSLFRITKYEHPIDYLPRDFADGREILVEDLDTGGKFNIFKDYDEIKCTHSIYDTKIRISMIGMEFLFTIFVPKDDPCECWMLSYRNNNDSNRNIKLHFSQIWSVSRFGIHTAEEGIPYLSTPGRDFSVTVVENGIIGESDNKELPVLMNVFFSSPQKCTPAYETLSETRKDGRNFNFTKTQLTFESEVLPGEKKSLMAVSVSDEVKSTTDDLFRKYSSSESFNSELNKVKQYKNNLIGYNTCSIPDKNMQNFLNIWLKHQLFLTYRYVRSGYIGYRDSLQDAWGYGLIEPELVRDKILRILSHMKKDGSCPRNFSPFGIDDEHDLRNFMDSGTWIGLALSGYIKETGDTAILYEKIRYLDDDKTETVEEHVWKALDLLYENRGRFGLCLIGAGDWNDGIEGISKKGPAVSVWLTMAVFHFQNL
ncbi:MAG: hypothetical protein R3232_10010, partial [Clostridia bacterium]|nr:hypothetical protein [Clostridia bacterium]